MGETGQMRAFGATHAVIADNLTLRTFIRWFGVNDYHSHIRWHAIRRYVDYDAAQTLEVGAGTGPMTFEVAARTSGEVVASEFDPDAVASAKEIQSKLGVTNVSFSQADLRTLAETEQFDQALVIDVLEHIDDHEAAVRHLAAAVKPGGRLIVSVPTPRYPGVFGQDFHERIGHVRDGYEIEDLRALLEPAGFRVREFHYYTGRVASAACSLYYRRGYVGMLGWMLMPPLWVVGLLGERRVRRKNAASVALVAERI